MKMTVHKILILVEVFSLAPLWSKCNHSGLNMKNDITLISGDFISKSFVLKMEQYNTIDNTYKILNSPILD